MLPLRSSAFMSFDAPALSPALSFSELMPFDFWPGAVSCARWLLAPSRSMSLDWADFGVSAGVALGDESRFIGAAAEPRSDGGALCCVGAAPEDGASRLMVPCALAKPVPAISAAAATDIK